MKNANKHGMSSKEEDCLGSSLSPRLTPADALTLYQSADLHALGAAANKLDAQKNGRKASAEMENYVFVDFLLQVKDSDNFGLKSGFYTKCHPSGVTMRGQ